MGIGYQDAAKKMQRADQQTNNNAKNESGINQSGVFQGDPLPDNNEIVSISDENDAIRT